MDTPRFTLWVAGLPLGIRGQDQSVIAALARRYAQFAPPNDQADAGAWELEVDWSPGEASAAVYSARVDFQPGEVCLAAPGFQAAFDEKEGRGRLELASPGPVEGVEYFARILYALLIHRAGGLLFHAAGIVRRGRAYVFFGPSGSGKSTVARLSPGDRVLNDDLLALLPAPGGWRVHATPFWNRGQPCANGQPAPLAGLYRLVQDRQVYVEAVRPAQALAEVMACMPVLPTDPARSAELIARAAGLVRAIPAYRLHFLPDPSFWGAVCPA